MNEYKPLSRQAIEQLQSQGCEAEDWNSVLFANEADVCRVRNVRFMGCIRIGRLQADLPIGEEFTLPSGIRQATLHNVTTGHNCLIEQVGVISNYHIGDEVIIQQTSSIATAGQSSFGNGVEVAVLDETGRRPVCIYPQLTAQEAYLQVMSPENKRLQNNAKQSAAEALSAQGHIDKGAVICGTQQIKNIHIGAYATISYAAGLENGTIVSCKEAPAHIGHGVLMTDFVMLTDAKVDSNARLTRCFVGQGTHIGGGFSAVDSLFFANCVAENGEACALFAGPYTVTHHKSTLLIGMMASFMNAGSGSNQSNHGYKFGPLHQGILERGCKTGSSSYLLWPAHIGAFSVVLGHHTSHPNTVDFPFSYLIEQEGQTVLVPGATLNTVGLVRDIEKWPKRDNRHPNHRQDCIDFNPYGLCIVNNMITGAKRMEKYLQTDEKEIMPQVLLSKTSATNGLTYYNQLLLCLFVESLIALRYPFDKKLDAPCLLQLIKAHCSKVNLPIEATDAAGAYLSDEKDENQPLNTLYSYLFDQEPDVESCAKLLKQYHTALLQSFEHLQKDALKEGARPGLEFDDASAMAGAFMAQQKELLESKLARLKVFEPNIR